MEFVDGTTLQQRLTNQRLSSGRRHSDCDRDQRGAREGARGGLRPPRFEARQHHADARRSRQSDGLRAGQARRHRRSGGDVEWHCGRRSARHARLHVAGAAERTSRRSSERHFRVRADPLRDARRGAPVCQADRARNSRRHARARCAAPVDVCVEVSGAAGSDHRPVPCKARGRTVPDDDRSARGSASLPIRSRDGRNRADRRHHHRRAAIPEPHRRSGE